MQRLPDVYSYADQHAFAVRDTKMAPKFQPGDLVYASPCHDIKVGNYVAIEVKNKPGRTMLRELIAMDQWFLYVRCIDAGGFCAIHKTAVTYAKPVCCVQFFEFVSSDRIEWSDIWKFWLKPQSLSVAARGY